MPQQIALLLASLFSINLLDVNIIFFAWIYQRKVVAIQCLSQLLLLFLSEISLWPPSFVHLETSLILFTKVKTTSFLL